MNTLTISPKLTDEQADALSGTFLDESHFDLLLGESVKVLKPDGQPLLIFLKGAIDPALCKTARDCLREAAQTTNNRGTAAGTVTSDRIKEINKSHKQAGRKTRYVESRKGRGRFVRAKLDGTLSNTLIANPVESGIVGYFDRNARIPYCRQTKYLVEHEERVKAAYPFILKINEVFAEYAPERHAAQMEIVRKTHPDFVLNKTAFTTITVNRNFRTACHKDAGDYRPGFGVLSVLQTGKYSGGYFTIPKYRVAVNMRTTDVLLADVHEWHGNTAITNQSANWERISCVFYYREKMSECGSAEEEQKVAASTVSSFEKLQARSAQ